MKAIVPLKITANEVGDEYYRLKQSDGVSECCMPLGRYDTPVSSQIGEVSGAFQPYPCLREVEKLPENLQDVVEFISIGE